VYCTLGAVQFGFPQRNKLLPHRKHKGREEETKEVQREALNILLMGEGCGESEILLL
jgi:hypothetical protein